MTDFYRIGIGMKFHSCLSSFPVYCLITVRICIPRSQYVLPSHGRREKTIALFVSDLRPSFHWRVGHDWNYMNLLWSIVHVPSIENTLSLSSHRRLCFLFWLSVTGPRSTTSFRILKFQFLIIWSLWKFAPVFICWWFRSPLFRATSWSNKAITIWSWTEVCYFDLYNPSRIDSEDISPTVKSAWSHPIVHRNLEHHHHSANL